MNEDNDARRKIEEFIERPAGRLMIATLILYNSVDHALEAKDITPERRAKWIAFRSELKARIADLTSRGLQDLYRSVGDQMISQMSPKTDEGGNDGQST